MQLPDLIKKPLFQRMTAGILAAAGIAFLILGLHKDIFLVINSQVQQHSTYALTVNGFLKSQGISLDQNDRIMPAPGTLIRNNEAIYLTVSSPVEVSADGETVSLTTAEPNPANILLEAGFQLYPKDRLLVDGKAASTRTRLSPGEPHQIQLLRATRISLLEGTDRIQFITDADTLGEALEKANFSLFPEDKLYPPRETALDGTPLSVELTRSKPLQVHLSNRTVTIRTTADTVGTALAGAGIALQGLDYSVPEEGGPLPVNDQIQVIRVKEEVTLIQEQIPFTSEYQPADDLELDQLQILSGGEYGLSAQRIRIVSENGTEVSRKVEKEWVIKEPVPRLIGYGTQVVLHTANTPDGQITYWRKITAYATSYNENCEGCKTYTASGADLRKGVIAVRLSWYRYMKGLKVYIPGYGFASIEDVGGGVPWSWNWVDLGYKSSEYVPWSENVTVYFLAPAPPSENIMYILN
jgi:uncharacterized protein YabE (DUF348 family)